MVVWEEDVVVGGAEEGEVDLVGWVWLWWRKWLWMWMWWTGSRDGRGRFVVIHGFLDAFVGWPDAVLSRRGYCSLSKEL